MKRMLMMALLAGGLLLVGSNSAEAHGRYGYGGRGFGSGVTISFGSSRGYGSFGYSNVSPYRSRVIQTNPYRTYGGWGYSSPSYSRFNYAPVYGYGGYHHHHCR